MTGILTGLMAGRIPSGIRERRMADFDEVVAEMVRTNRESANSVSATPDSSLTLGSVFAAAGLLADTIGMLPLILYEKQGDNRRRAEEHYLFPILHDAPNEIQTAVEFRSAMQGYLALRGNAIAQVEFDGAGKITELWPLRWENVQEMRVDKENGRILYHYMLPDTSLQWLDSSSVWHLRGWGSDGLVGYSPITLARRAVTLGLSAQEFGVRFFENDARPGIVLEHPAQLSQKAHENLRDSFEERHQGVSKSHRVAILEEGLKLHEIGIPPEDAQFLETRKFSVTEIARFFRVPPHMIYDLERSTFTNIEHQGIEFVTYSLQSWFTRWEQSIKKNLLTESDRKRYYAEHLADALLRGDTLNRYQAYQSGIQSGWMTRADARKKENLEPIEGLEKPLVPLNMMTVSEDGSVDEPPAAETQSTEEQEEEENLTTETQSERSDAEREERKIASASPRNDKLRNDTLSIDWEAIRRTIRLLEEPTGAEKVVAPNINVTMPAVTINNHLPEMKPEITVTPSTVTVQNEVNPTPVEVQVDAPVVNVTNEVPQPKVEIKTASTVAVVRDGSGRIVGLEVMNDE